MTFCKTSSVLAETPRKEQTLLRIVFCALVHIYAVCVLNVSPPLLLLTMLCEWHLARIDSPILDRFSDKVIDQLSSGANGIQQLDLGWGSLLEE